MKGYDQFSSLFTRYLHYEDTLEGYDQFSSLFTRYLHYEDTLEGYDQFSSLFTRYLHYEDTLEDVGSQILPLGLAHKPTDNTEHAENCL